MLSSHLSYLYSGAFYIYQISSISKPVEHSLGYRRVPTRYFADVEGIARTILEDLVGGEGRMIEPMTEELLFIWQRTSWSAESSKTNGWWT